MKRTEEELMVIKQLRGGELLRLPPDHEGKKLDVECAIFLGERRDPTEKSGSLRELLPVLHFPRILTPDLIFSTLLLWKPVL